MLSLRTLIVVKICLVLLLFVAISGRELVNAKRRFKAGCRPTPDANSDICAKITDQYKSRRTITMTNRDCFDMAAHYMKDLMIEKCHEGKCRKGSLDSCSIP